MGRHACARASLRCQKRARPRQHSTFGIRASHGNGRDGKHDSRGTLEHSSSLNTQQQREAKEQRPAREQPHVWTVRSSRVLGHICVDRVLTFERHNIGTKRASRCEQTKKCRRTRRTELTSWPWSQPTRPRALQRRRIRPQGPCLPTRTSSRRRKSARCAANPFVRSCACFPLSQTCTE